MKLTMKAKRYVLNAACTCPKGTTSQCGINYRNF